MTKKTGPTAWDDDWESQADKEDKETGGAPLTAEPVVLSRAERLAKHKEEQRRLWKSADEPEDFPFLAVSSSIPVGAIGIKPAMKVLSRKPAPQMIKRRDPVTGLEQLTIRDDAAEAAAEAEAEAARNQLTPEQMRQRQQREREEKQRKYDQARAKIFGEPLPRGGAGAPAATAAGASTATIPATAAATAAAAGSSSVASSRQVSPISPAGGYGNNGNRGRGRGRGNNGGGGGGYGRRAQQAGHAGSGTASRELFDPSYLPRTTGPHQRRGGGGPGNGGSGSGSDMGWSPSPSRSGTPRDDDYVIRAPRGPDGSGRGGFGFARRGS
ncbi:hypothetical protein CMQ_382 [Grosmannia clavigera kw1407]|uniref:SUZ-C domain-containing protein n=1 Tax=Grosmannia clavigera (strain kw1407 / UAMH 11150) TaxID=655863 RepID=F0XFU5_GROCL|nr:uncharacterized protein CMQ_382 [Grosmannia clavigera kw1407]EFX03454.1 hypothetical protein CMQ_382 [Grosmannia clavigera kw1407]